MKRRDERHQRGGQSWKPREREDDGVKFQMKTKTF